MRNPTRFRHSFTPSRVVGLLVGALAAATAGAASLPTFHLVAERPVLREKGPDNERVDGLLQVIGNGVGATVHLEVSGNAVYGITSGADYSWDSPGVTVLAPDHVSVNVTGFAELVLRPRGDGLPEGDEFITIRLMASPAYEIGEPSEVTFRVLDHDAPNLLPSLELVTNEDNRRFLVRARDPDGSIVRVEALDDDTPLATTFAQPVPGTEPDFWYVALPPTAWARGTLRLRAHDNAGGTATLNVFPATAPSPFRVISIPDEHRLTETAPVPAGTRVRLEFEDLPGVESVEFTYEDTVFLDTQAPWEWEIGSLPPGSHTFAGRPAPNSVAETGELTVVVVAGGPTLVWTEPLESAAYEQGQQPATFLLRRTGSGIAAPLQVGLTTTAVEETATATPGLDFNLPPDVEFPAGEDAVLVTVTPVEDEIEEPTEMIAVELAASEGVTLFEARRVLSVRDNDHGRIDATLPVLQIVSPEDGALLPATTVAPPYFVTLPGESEIPEGTSIQWLANGVPTLPSAGSQDYGYYTLAARLIRENGTAGPESAPVRCRIVGDRQSGDSGILRADILWPDDDVVIPTNASFGQTATVAVLLQTDPPIEPENTPEVTVYEAGRTTPSSLESYGAGLHVVRFALQSSGRHVVEIQVTAGLALAPFDSIYGRTKPLVLHVGEFSKPLPASTTFGALHLRLAHGELFDFDQRDVTGDAAPVIRGLLPILPFPPATRWGTFGEGAAGATFLASDTEGRLWRRENGWHQLLPYPPVTGWKWLAAAPWIGSGAGISAAGELYVWGSPLQWTETDGSPDAGPADDSPRRVSMPAGVRDWTQVALGAYHALALRSTGELYTWGRDNLPLEALPPGSVWEWPPRVARPTEVPPPPGATGWRAIAAGHDTSFALSSNGEIYAWGSNRGAQLHVTPAADPVLRPTRVARPTSVTQWTRLIARPRLVAVGQDGEVYRFVERSGAMRELRPIWPSAKWVDLAGERSPALLGDDGSIFRGVQSDEYQWVANLSQLTSAFSAQPPITLAWDPPDPAAVFEALGPVNLRFHPLYSGNTNALEVTAYTRRGRRGWFEPLPHQGQVTLDARQLNGGWNTVMLKSVAEDGRIAWSDPLHFVTMPAFVSPERVPGQDDLPYAISPTYHDDPLVSAYHSAVDPEVYVLEGSANLRDWQEEGRLKASDSKMFLPPMDQPSEERRFYRLRWIESEY
ncbi:MAG: hypothetical protein H7A46_14910 [Verrucomicrobiales bacterium]|nr:hypothetical protein [Verrucomicrobiales bacterium]